MRIYSWNVNGLRARIKQGFYTFYEDIKPDVLCLQEIKLVNDTICKTFLSNEVNTFWNICEFIPAYSGTMVRSIPRPLNVMYGLDDDTLDQEGRNIILEFPDFFLVSVYMPNAEHKLTRRDLRLEWDDHFSQKIEELADIKPIVLCGDLNCTLSDEDVRHTLPRSQSPKFIDDTRYNILKLMDDCNLVDAYRELHPDVLEAYTWWSIRTKKKAENIGWRLDYFLVSEELMPKVKSCGMHSDVFGSDHCPIFLEIDL